MTQSGGGSSMARRAATSYCRGSPDPVSPMNASFTASGRGVRKENSAPARRVGQRPAPSPADPVGVPRRELQPAEHRLVAERGAAGRGRLLPRPALRLPVDAAARGGDVLVPGDGDGAVRSPLQVRPAGDPCDRGRGGSRRIDGRRAATPAPRQTQHERDGPRQSAPHGRAPCACARTSASREAITCRRAATAASTSAFVQAFLSSASAASRTWSQAASRRGPSQRGLT